MSGLSEQKRREEKRENLQHIWRRYVCDRLNCKVGKGFFFGFLSNVSYCENDVVQLVHGGSIILVNWLVRWGSKQVVCTLDRDFLVFVSDGFGNP